MKNKCAKFIFVLYLNDHSQFTKAIHRYIYPFVCQTNSFNSNSEI